MEILSTGEKVKRARIYKGYTLKDICNDKISVSKMSCIENDKIKAEDWILELLSDKLNIDLGYLKQDIKDQIIRNIELLEKDKNTEGLEENLLYNLRFSEKYNYYDLSFKIVHILFNCYLDNKENEKVQGITSKFYDLCQKLGSEDNQLIYYMDMARYLYNTGEFLQAAHYYNNVRKTAKEKQDYKALARSTYNEAACFVMLENLERAYEIAVRIEDLIDYIDDDLRKAEVYHMLAILSLSMDNGKFEQYEEKSYELYSFNSQFKAEAMYNYAAAMFGCGYAKKAVEYIEMSLELYPKENKEVLVEFMLSCISELLENEILDVAQKFCDDVLDLAIGLDNVKYIEKSYYYKSLILEKQKDYYSAEMYMNLSLDSLLKFGSKMDVYKRYMEMGHMYYILGQIKESIKYFNLAIVLQKKM